MRTPVRISALCSAALAVAAFQAAPVQPRPMLLVNATGQTITHFYVSINGRSGWQEDLLGEDVITAGASARIHIYRGADECRVDLRARLADGTESDRRDVNVCGIAAYRLTPDSQRPTPAGA